MCSLSSKPAKVVQAAGMTPIVCVGEKLDVRKAGEQVPFVLAQVDKVLAERDEKLVRAGAKLTPAYFKRAYNLQDGDLDEAPQPVTPAAEFAESETGFPDQQALDEIVASLSAETLDEEAGAILRPLLDDLLAARDEDAAMALLGNAYPQLDSSLLEERLAQLMFAAELIGRVSAADETKP